MRPAEYAEFAAALCDAQASVPAFIRAPAGAAVADRFAVYRNNIHVSLVDTLTGSFPIVRAQVGEEFFNAMARAFVQEHKPATPQLHRYGEEFAAFIAGFAPAASVPWLPDLARLERAWLDCWAAADAPVLHLKALQRVDAAQLARSGVQVHPAARLIRSAWPIADLWQAHQAAQPDLGDMQWQPQNVLLTRPLAEVLLRSLDDASAGFTAALIAGDSIEVAAHRHPQVDAGMLLAQLIGDGMIQELRT